MAEPEAEPTVRAYVHVLRKRQWWVAAFTLLGLAVSLALSLTQQKQYSASAQLLVQATGGINLALGSAVVVIEYADARSTIRRSSSEA